VLACVPGLERDAQIALSCQFSITDISVDYDGSSATKNDGKVITEKEVASNGSTETKPAT